MLARASFGDQPGFAHPRGQQGLADGVVDLVGAGVVEVLALEIDLGAAQSPAPAFRVIERGGAADVAGQVRVQFPEEFGVAAIGSPGIVQLVQGFHQGFSDEPATVAAEMAVDVGELAVIHLIAQDFHSRTHLAEMHASVQHP